MIPYLRPHPFGKAFLAAAGFLAWAGTAGMSGCKPIDLEAVPEDSLPQDTNTAILRITNKLDVDPDILTFYLFPGTATDFANAAGARKIGSVPVNSTRQFTVPAGTWKIAYSNPTGVLTPLQDDESEAWPKCMLEKDGDFFLILATDGPDVIWSSSFPTSP